MSVVIRSNSGSWQYEALKKNDPILSELVPDLPEDEIPDVIILGESISNIFEEEWKYIQMIRDWIDGLAPRRESRSHSRYVAPGMIELVEGDLPFSDLLHLPQLVYLHQVSRISRLVTMPDNWQICVGVDEHSPPQERMDHILAMGRVIRELDLRDTTDGYVLPNQDANGMYDYGPPATLLAYSITNLQNWIDRVTPFYSEEELVQHQREGLEDVASGLVRNSVIRTCDLGQERKDKIGLAWKTILWEDVQPLIERYGQTYRLLFNTAAFLSGNGRGDINQETFDTRLSPVSYAFSDSDVGLLYGRILASYPLDTPLKLFGLDPNKEENPTITRGMYLELNQVIPAVHHILKEQYFSLKMFESSTAQNADTPVFSDLDAKYLLQDLGSQALNRILLSNLYSLENQKNAKVNRNAQEIEEYLKDHPEQPYDLENLSHDYFFDQDYMQEIAEDADGYVAFLFMEKYWDRVEIQRFFEEDVVDSDDDRDFEENY